ncbi:hypothetical protein HNQ93_000207 [Hymenobacter luteus]|uniref:Orphan protein n=2 Tax=Hymenobacter TaxID=89966 RepID=A0A7W9SWW2_9BACT|nr:MULTISPECIES: DUF6702 family protein [Hymenobacter]MBB4600313.1 hypothetical protein [Hymenobacter latericoloratus]MBB6057377.1 hypothetical protein [Hymenobacter luteus]
MFSFSSFRRIGLVAALLLAAHVVAWAHAYHASILEVRFNPGKQRLEMALKIFIDDLEQSLSVGKPTPVRTDQLARAQLDPLLMELLRRSVQFSARPGQALPLTLVGLQKEKDSYWVYFTAPMPAAATSVSLRHQLLLDLFPDQMNIVNLEAKGQKQSLLFRDGETQQQLKW